MAHNICNINTTIYLWQQLHVCVWLCVYVSALIAVTCNAIDQMQSF